MAIKKRKRALKTAEIIINKINISEKESYTSIQPKKAIGDKELNSFIQTYVDYRNRLDIKPQTKEGGHREESKRKRGTIKD